MIPQLSAVKDSSIMVTAPMDLRVEMKGPRPLGGAQAAGDHSEHQPDLPGGDCVVGQGWPRSSLLAVPLVRPQSQPLGHGMWWDMLLV